MVLDFLCLCNQLCARHRASFSTSAIVGSSVVLSIAATKAGISVVPLAVWGVGGEKSVEKPKKMIGSLLWLLFFFFAKKHFSLIVTAKGR